MSGSDRNKLKKSVRKPRTTKVNSEQQKQQADLMTDDENLDIQVNKKRSRYQEDDIDDEADDEAEEESKVEKEIKKKKPNRPHYDTYKLKDSENKDEVLESLSKAKHTQKTASTYHSIYEHEFEKGKNKDQLHYRRNQNKHRFPDRKNKKQGEFGYLSKIEKINKDEKVLEDSKLDKYSHNLGMDPSFGHQIKHKSELQEGEESVSKVKSEVSAAKKSLDDDILNHKVAAVSAIVNGLQNPEEPFKTIKVNTNQLDAKYPCVIIKLDDAYGKHRDMKALEILNQYNEIYPEFLTHLMIACINKQLMDKKLGVYFDRRQSFGHLTPTASDVGSAIRLSLGLVPNPEWQEAVVAGIKDFDKIVDKLWQDKVLSIGEKAENGKKGQGDVGLPQSRFKAGDVKIFGHKLFLKALHESKTKEIPPKTLVTVIKNLNDKDKFNQINQQVVKKDHFKTMVQALKKGAASTQVSPSEEFIDLSTRIEAVYDKLNKTDEQANSSKTSTKTSGKKVAATRSNNTILTDIVGKIEQYQDNSIDNYKTKEDLTATSGSEREYDQVLNADQKYYTPTGMSALSAPLIAYKIALARSVSYKAEVERVTYKVEQYAYFELADWQTEKGASKIDKKTSKETQEDNYNVNIVYVDNNPCVNEDIAPISTLAVIDEFSPKLAKDGQKRMLVVDTTSATEEQKEQIIEKWQQSNIAMLCFAASGLKNKQLGLDMAQYGENRLLINQGLKSIFTQQVAESLRQITKGSSSAYAITVMRDMRNATSETAEIAPLVQSKVSSLMPPSRQSETLLRTASLTSSKKFAMDSDSDEDIKVNIKGIETGSKRQ